jgi:hypothetical protein
MKQLMYVGQQTADSLADNIGIHLERYRDGDFLDLENEGDWRIHLSIKADVDAFARLSTERSPEAEVANSLLVGRALRELTPSLARENRIWVRLSHIEGLVYGRSRWLKDVSEDKLESTVRVHFFAPTWTQCRDDHALGRLWWNYQIASMLMPEDPGLALELILSRADIRLSFVERPRIGARLPLSRGILRLLAADPALRQSEPVFRRFMKVLNLRGAGRVFEVWDDSKIDSFLADCAREAARRQEEPEMA